MFNQQVLETELGIEEGDKVRRYLDTKGHWTIGKGHNLDVSPLPEGWTEPLTEAQINTLLDRDIAGTLTRLDIRLPWWRQSPVANEIADMGYNMGVGQSSPPSGLLAFSTFLSLIKSGQFAAAADDLKGTLWHRQVGNRATAIEARIRAAI